MKRYSAGTSWYEPLPWDWSLLADIERFLLDRLSSDRGIQREIDTRDSNGDISATTIVEARERIETDNTELEELTLSIWTGPEKIFEGRSEMAATMRVHRYEKYFDVKIDFSGLDDTVARRLKVDFDAWRERRSISLARSAPESVPQQPTGRISESLARRQQQSPWWKPNIHNVRDNLLANLLWLLLLALSGLVLAWLRMR